MLSISRGINSLTKSSPRITVKIHPTTMNQETPENVSDEIRYQGKAVYEDEWIAEFLSEQKSCVIGLSDGNSPHLVTELIVHEKGSGAIYVHGAQGGRLYDIVNESGNLPAQFTTSQMGRFIPANEPVNFTVEYSSVIGTGTIKLIKTPAKKRDILELFMEKFAPHLVPGEDYEDMSEESVDRTAVYEFDVNSWSGKHGYKSDDIPGAYVLD